MRIPLETKSTVGAIVLCVCGLLILGHASHDHTDPSPVRAAVVVSITSNAHGSPGVILAVR